MADKQVNVSIRKGVGSVRSRSGVLENIWLYHVLVDGHNIRSFTSPENAEDYIVKTYGHVPLVRRAY